MKKQLAGIVAAAVLGMSAHVEAADYTIDTAGAHAFVQFRVKHMGFSWLYGRFNKFEGSFTFDEKDPSKNKVDVTVDVTSLDSNHAERDKHLRSGDYLNASKFPKATFVSTAYKPTGEKTAELTGNLTLHGVTKPITIDVEHIGIGKDPWGGFRAGFEGRATIKPQDWGIKLGEEVELFLTAEGIRK
jgi:polyisoprenoid-binding protein YceI